MKVVRYLSVLFFIGFGTNLMGTPPTGKYQNVLERLFALQKKYPEFSRIISIGKNDEGTPLFAIRISTTPAVADPRKAGHILVSTHHGNEPDTPEFTLAFIEDLLKRYSSDELWRGQLAQMEYSIIPVLNVTGYNTGKRRERDIDPNRNYPGPCNDRPKEVLGSVTRLMEFLKTRIFAGSVTVHGYITSLTYPWGFHTDNPHSQDRNRYDFLVKKAAEHNGYPAGNGAEVVYPANGCYEDYVYWKHGSWSMLVELDSGSADDIKNTVRAVATYFDLLDMSPSTKNVFTGKCTDPNPPDMGME